MSDDLQENWYRQKVGRRVERGMNAVLGVFPLIVGLGAIALTGNSEDFAYSTHWPGLAVGGLLLSGALFCLRSKKSVIQEFGDEPVQSTGQRRTRD